MRHNVDREDIIGRLKPLLLQSVGFSEASLSVNDLALVGEHSGVDSVGLLRLVMSLEREFGIVIEDADINPANFETLSGLLALIERKLVR